MSDPPPPPSPENTGLATSSAAAATATDDTGAVATSSATATATATDDTEAVTTSSAAATDDTAIERPKPSQRGYVAEVYKIIGINNRRSRKPIIALVNKVWMARPEWAIALESYSELDTTERDIAEKDLQRELEAWFPPTSFTATQIRRCQGWLAGHLLSEKHKHRNAADRSRV